LGTHADRNQSSDAGESQVAAGFNQCRRRKYDEQRGEIGGFGSVPEKIEVVQRIVHDGEVNRARHLPAKPNVIATQTVAGAVTIFDYTKHASQPDPQQRSAKPDLVCLGHTAEGFSLAWSPLKSGKLLAGAEDKLICLWDVEAAPRAARELAALQTFAGHTAGVQDVGFHPHNEHVFGSCDDNGLLLLWDPRQANPLSQRVTAHRAAVNSLAFNPYCEFVLATASADNNVALWDLRNLHTPVHVLVGHQAEVMRVEWAPFCERVLASGGNDRRVHLWDCARIGAEQSADDAEDGVPELLFVHGGHTGKINDLNWNPNEAWVLGSTSEDNVVQVWAMAESIYDDDANIAEDN
jgi:histone-binding protein RBBP4